MMILTRFVGLLTLTLSLGLLSGCATNEINREAIPTSTAIANPESTFLGRVFGPEADAHPGQSGFYLLDKGENALIWRAALADAAISTLDAQYFIWSDDNVGTLAAERLLQAAERGIRVRVLLDDFMLNTDPAYLAHLHAHPLIEIRIYNPLGADYGKDEKRQYSLLHDLRRLNRRMHNKVFVADGSVAIVGGRNIADEYFDMDDKFNFRDRDVLAAGPIVPEISASFDAYWNSEWSVPIDRLLDTGSTLEARQAYYNELHRYAAHPENFPMRFYGAVNEVRDQLLALSDRLIWGKSIVIYDIPGKNDDPKRLDAFGKSGRALTQVALQSRHEIIAETPYLLFMPGTFEVVEKLRQRGVRVRFLTNSLSSTDAIPVFAAYMKQRLEMLRLGLEIHEMKADPAFQEKLLERYALLKEKPPVALHAKTAVFDRQIAFIGSFNLDPRSTHLNTEIGLLIYSREFAEQLVEVMEKDFLPSNSYRVRLNSELEWTAEESGEEKSWRTDPKVGPAKGMKLLFYSLLPLSDYL